MPIAGFYEKRDVSVPLPADERDFIPFDAFDWGSIQACFRGEASAHQQRRVIEWLLYASGNHETSYRRDPHAQAFVEGRRFLGVQLVRILNMTMPKGNTNAT